MYTQIYVYGMHEHGCALTRRHFIRLLFYGFFFSGLNGHINWVRYCYVGVRSCGSIHECKRLYAYTWVARSCVNTIAIEIC